MSDYYEESRLRRELAWTKVTAVAFVMVPITVLALVLGLVYIDYLDKGDWEPDCPDLTPALEWNPASGHYDICAAN